MIVTNSFFFHMQSSMDEDNELYLTTLESGPVVSVEKEYRQTLFSAQYVQNGFTNGAVVCVLTCCRYLTVSDVDNVM